jgi:bacterioferritin-associated ferredoxin
MVICSCRAIFESEVRAMLLKNPDIPVQKIMTCEGCAKCCERCRDCTDAVKQIIAEHSVNFKDS